MLRPTFRRRCFERPPRSVRSISTDLFPRRQRHQLRMQGKRMGQRSYQTGGDDGQGPLRSGSTQIQRVFECALREARGRKTSAMIYIGDDCEEEHKHLVRLARELGSLGVPVFLFQEGYDSEAESSSVRSPKSPTVLITGSTLAAPGYWVNCSRRSRHSRSAASRLWNVRARQQRGFYSDRCASPPPSRLHSRRARLR